MKPFRHSSSLPGAGSLFLVGLAVGAVSAQELFHVSLQVDFRPDVGQSWGSLFEIRDEVGRVVAGAGFADIYNTLFRNDRFTVQFFIRPKQDPGFSLVERFPRPTQAAGVYLFNLEGKLYAWSWDQDRTLRVWNEAQQQWEESALLDGQGMAFGDGQVRVGSGMLQFTQSRISYNGQVLLPPPEEGFYHNFYYAQGHLVFYHSKADPNGYAKLVACPWTPEREGPVDLAQAQVLPMKYPRETTFAFGQLRGEVLTCSNIGGLYVFNGRDWRVLREPNDQVSYQIYSMVNYYDRLLMGHYPSGNLMAYDGRTVTLLEDWPPVMEGVSHSGREAQTTMIYGGELYVGVWPWAELWRYDPEALRWNFLGRLFTRPPLTDQVNHPYEKEINDFNVAHATKIVYNEWGQRVASLVPMGDSLIVSTSAKGPWKRDARRGFLTDEVFQEYGQMVRFKKPGNLAATLAWKEGPTQLEFVLTADQMRIFQDGELLASTDLNPDLTTDFRPAEVVWGYGVFGSFQGTLQSPSVVPDFER